MKHWDSRQIIRLLAALLVFFIFIFVQGCATIVKGRTQEVTFKSEPEGATVTVNGRALGKTPLTMQLDRKSEQIANFEKEGYKTETIPLTTTITGWFWGNIAVGGLLGSTTDGVSGAANEYSPSQYHVTLVSTTESKTRDSLRGDVKTFIIGNYRNIFEELNTQAGQYLKSLISLLKITSDRSDTFLKDIKVMSSC